MNKFSRKIILDCERMKYPNTGLYHYCLNLGIALQNTINKETEEVYFYVRKNAKQEFTNSNNFLHQHSLHKFYMPFKKKNSIWHCTYQGSNYFPLTKKFPVVLTIHDLNFLYDTSKNKKKKAQYLAQVAAKINSANYIIAISQFVLNDIQQHFDLKNKPCKVIYNGCNTALQINSLLPAITKQIKAPFIYTIGTVLEKKNFHVLPCLLQNNNRLLIISGQVQSQEYKKKIIIEAQKYGVENRVIFTGPISEQEKNWYLQNCECFAFPSLAEGFGLPVIEAMYYGKPVLLSTLTSLPEIGGDVAYYFRDFNPTNMQGTLQESLQHYQTFNPTQKIKERAAIFDWNNAAEEYLEVYRSLL